MNPKYMLTTTAHIGGVAKNTNGLTGKQIDTYNVDTKEEIIGVAEMEFDRKHFSCALIPKGKDGNPTVAICKIICII